MTNLRTSETLISALKRASSKELTSDEINRQRISFIYGSLKPDSGITKDRIREVLDQNTGKKAIK
jgi:hypothetical protein